VVIKLYKILAFQCTFVLLWSRLKLEDAGFSLLERTTTPAREHRKQHPRHRPKPRRGVFSHRPNLVCQLFRPALPERLVLRLARGGVGLAQNTKYHEPLVVQQSSPHLDDDLSSTRRTVEREVGSSRARNRPKSCVALKTAWAILLTHHCLRG